MPRATPRQRKDRVTKSPPPPWFSPSSDVRDAIIEALQQDWNAFGEGMPAKDIFANMSAHICTTKSMVNRLLYQMENLGMVYRASTGETKAPYWQLHPNESDSE